MDQSPGVAIIGVGTRWSRQLAAVVQRSNILNLISCYARTPDHRDTFAAEFGCRSTSTLEEALETKGVEGVLITAPAHVHPEITYACAARGLHVFVEKPMALTLQEALQMKAECVKAGVVLMVNLEMRRLGSSKAMKSVIESGRLGKVVAGSAAFTLPGVISPDNWRGNRQTNRGGALMQLGIHHIDTLRYLFGEISSVRGFFAHTSAPVDIDDVAFAQLTFSNGAQVVVLSTYVSPKVYELRFYGDVANLECTVDMQVWPDARQVDERTQLSVQSASGREAVRVEPQDCLADQIDEFARCMRGETKPETGADEGIAALTVVEAALRSFTQGAPVDPRSIF